MKPLLLHGPAKTASRKVLIEFKQKFDQNNVVVFEEGSNLQRVLDTLSVSSLFPDQQLIILENPLEDFTNYTSSSLSDLRAEGLHPTSHTLILWFDHEVNSKKPILESVKKVKGEIVFFPEAKEMSVFPFLDYLAAKDKKAFLELSKLKIAGFDIQYFLTMVFYLLRNLVATPKNAPEFVRNKLQRQRKNFPLDKVTKLYKEILEIDFKIKSGLLEKEQAEFLLVNKFTENPVL